MEYNGQKFIAAMRNGRFETGPEFYYDSTDCSGTPYVRFESAESITGNLGVGFGVPLVTFMYLPVEGASVIPTKMAHSKKRTNDGVCLTDNWEVTWVYPYQQAFDITVEFQPPLRMIYGHVAQ
jgi:hypothetical protein